MQHVSSSGLITLSSVSKMCAFRGREHKCNHIKFVACMQWPFPRVFISCEDTEDCIPLIRAQTDRLTLPVSEQTWIDLGYPKLIREYVESQEITEEFVLSLFQ